MNEERWARRTKDTPFRLNKAEFEKLRDGLGAIMTRLGAVKRPAQGNHHDGWWLATKGGTLVVHRQNANSLCAPSAHIITQFETPELSVLTGLGNAHNGKWNLHFHHDQIDDMLGYFEQQLQRIIWPTT